MQSLFLSHITFAYISLVLLLVRGVLSAKQVDWRQFKILKIAPHAIDTVLLLSGLTIFFYVDYPLQPWLIAKFLFLVFYIVFSVKAFKKSTPFSLKHFILAVVSFMMMLLVATVK